MADEPDEGEQTAAASRRWSAILIFLVMLAISAGTFAVALLDQGADDAAPPTPAPPAMTAPAESPMQASMPATPPTR